ncbi:hypothetical protein [Rhizobium sp. PL01]|uniref:hypothetical protein n=1 Tax=Rhizobium sp. PL01 TaxID=3085631 RepID=UPI00298251F5|nr:hypothetical protein [Rhizobium sp. PL01]MDW5316154.1 hypothetical protein [Rhizobium sp. PL01]
MAFAVNIRTTLRLVGANPATRRLANCVIGKAAIYSSLRHSGKSAELVGDAHRALDEADVIGIAQTQKCDGFFCGFYLKDHFRVIKLYGV